MAQNRLVNARILAIFAFVCLVWAVSIAAFLKPGLAFNLALIPRATNQWWGIFTNTLVHQNLAHLLTNTTPLVLFLLLLHVKGNRTFFIALPLCLVLAAVPLWLFGRDGAHIGASGLIFALFGFLVANAFFARRPTDFMIAVAVILAYWGLLAGLLPSDPTISWDGHLAGAVGGVFSSWVVSRVAVFRGTK